MGIILGVIRCSCFRLKCYSSVHTYLTTAATTTPSTPTTPTTAILRRSMDNNLRSKRIKKSKYIDSQDQPESKIVTRGLIDWGNWGKKVGRKV